MLLGFSAPWTGGDSSEKTELVTGGFSAPGTGGGRSKQTELLLLGGFSSPRTGGGRSEQTVLLLLLGGFSWDWWWQVPVNRAAASAAGWLLSSLNRWWLVRALNAVL